ncbi:MAG: putative sulfate exporter family transporter [Alphaproteobacteria bacterium]|nr:putative sulfate exporter family transporter [Alphaproteobacteria bacterium]
MRKYYLPSLLVAISVALSVFTSSPAIGLVCGVAISFLFKNNDCKNFSGVSSKILLQLAVVLLGFSMKINDVISVGSTSVGITFISIALTLSLGFVIGKALKVEKEQSLLVSCGTAICGGSAIAAMSSSIKASSSNTAIAMAVVFMLNAVALVVFPFVGEWFHLSQKEFGIFSALAIHDTSSVVGAAAIFGAEALAVGTVIKLTRALWILPLSLLGSFVQHTDKKIRFQWFLLGFLCAAVIRSYFPEYDETWNVAASVGKKMMVATLFFIGLCITLEDIKKVGWRPLVQAVALWVLVSVGCLSAIKYGLLDIDLPNLI